ncbi:MAG: T9SS type A sorting domain-containing protein [Balneolaceae bacterium]|nr:T9SS type A sorting domain-containing protein [Balneolaceae bacterium]MBO6545978.1 T9SS type A sorting domain-containing protein [Balneolaceae bacterium]MBO6647374.1 T9SS type A sorting domain-containing protein [Balneolaceae bacterium]
MIKATIKRLASFSLMILLAVISTSTAQAQNTLMGPELIDQGDFAGDTLAASWNVEGGANGMAAVVNGELAITDLAEVANIYDFQVNQNLSAEDIAELAKGGTFEVSFDARSELSEKTFHVFLGEVGGSWARYWQPGADGDVTVTNETQRYTLTTNVEQAWDAMRLGFEVAGDTSDLFLDNISLRRVEDNILIDGEVVIGEDSLSTAWTQLTSPASATFSVANGAVKISEISGIVNSYDVQFIQILNEEQVDSIYAGPYEFIFDARTSASEKQIQAYFGNNGTDGDWTNFAPTVMLDDTMRRYKLNVDASQNWTGMKVGFEVSADTSSVWFDNIILRRVREVAPEAPNFTLATTDGVVTITADGLEGGFEYEVYFADSAFTSTDGATSVGTFLASEGLTFQHSTDAPHPSLATDFTAHYGLVAKTEKGSASEVTVSSIETGMTAAENYIVELSGTAADAVFDAIDAGTVPEASVLAGFFPDGYKPFEISESSGRKIIENGSGGDDDADISGKMWIGFDAASSYLFIYAEITDDVLVPTPKTTTGGGGWQYDSWEMGIGAYSPESFINGSDHQSFEGADEPDFQLRAGIRADTADYMHGNDGGTSFDVDNINNSATIGDDSPTGMYRLLSIVNTNAFQTYNAEAAAFVFPTGTGVSTIPFTWTINDADAGTRDTQVGWSTKGGQDDWWNTPARWETVALVGADAIPTSNEDEGQDRVSEFSLDQNYPNPFNPTTNISFKLGTSSNVTLEVYNLLGQKVATILQNQKLSAGSHSQKFDASRLASGLYVYRISTESFTQSRKMMLIK